MLSFSELSVQHTEIFSNKCTEKTRKRILIPKLHELTSLVTTRDVQLEHFFATFVLTSQQRPKKNEITKYLRNVQLHDRKTHAVIWFSGESSQAVKFYNHEKAFNNECNKSGPALILVAPLEDVSDRDILKEHHSRQTALVDSEFKKEDTEISFQACQLLK